MDTKKLDAKGRKILIGSRGAEYVLSKTGKRTAPATLNENRKVARKVTKNIFAKLDYKKGKKPKQLTKEQELALKFAKKWKGKVNNRSKPMKKKNYDPEIFQMVAPKIRINALKNMKIRYNEVVFPIESVRGRRVEKKAVIAPLPENFRHSEYLADQTEYIKNLSIYDLMTVMSYTNYSHFWLGPYQRSGHVFSSFPQITREMIYPMWSQFDVIAGAGYDTLKSNAPNELRVVMEKYPTIVEPSSRYMLYIVLANENAISKDTYSLMLQMFVNDLRRIIINAPVSKESIIVYRGTSSDVYPKGTKKFVSNQFMSTAYLPSHALKYARGHQGILTRIRIPPGKPSLFIASVNQFGEFGEFEIVLPDASYEILGRNKTTQVFDGTKFVKVRVTDLKML